MDDLPAGILPIFGFLRVLVGLAILALGQRDVLFI